MRDHANSVKLLTLEEHMGFLKSNTIAPKYSRSRHAAFNEQATSSCSLAVPQEVEA